jgi:hypothetical protein
MPFWALPRKCCSADPEECRPAREASDMPQLINWELVKEPVNWIIVALMLMIATFGLCLLIKD